MKGELKGKVVSEFVGSKSKTYQLIDVDSEETKKTNGVNKNVVKSIRHKKFVDALLNKKIMKDSMKRIQSKLRRIRSYDVCKISLPCFDDKRYILGDGINSLAYFHKDIRGQ